MVQMHSYRRRSTKNCNHGFKHWSLAVSPVSRYRGEGQTATKSPFNRPPLHLYRSKTPSLPYPYPHMPSPHIWPTERLACYGTHASPTREPQRHDEDRCNLHRRCHMPISPPFRDSFSIIKATPVDRAESLDNSITPELRVSELSETRSRNRRNLGRASS